MSRRWITPLIGLVFAIQPALAVAETVAYRPWIAFVADAALREQLSRRSWAWIRIGGPDCRGALTLRVDIAATSEARAKGLSGRRLPLKEGEGMLFLFDENAGGSFWMKDTWVPLSIAFFSGQGDVLASSEMKKEDDPGNPRTLYSPGRAYSVAVEGAPGVLTRARGGDRLCVGY